jgi:predicted peptidase
MMTDRGVAAFLLAAVLACGCAAAPASVPASVSRQVERKSGGMRYLLHLPASYETRSDWPVILFLHGAGERGQDIDLVRREGLPRILDTLPDFPFVVVSPQEEKGRLWTPDDLSDLLKEVIARFRVDRTRVSVTGLSTGATSALELAIRHPELVAAVAAVAPTTAPASPCAMRDVPVWIFQNSGDERVPVSRSRKLARDLEQCGGRGEVRLTIYPRDGHDAWTETYRRQDLYDWMSRRGPAP